MLASLLLGLCLARFNVFAALVAAAVCAAGSAIYAVARDSSLTFSVLTSLAIGLVLPVGYLIGQLLGHVTRTARQLAEIGLLEPDRF
jgi:hypothetical protein